MSTMRGALMMMMILAAGAPALPGPRRRTWEPDPEPREPEPRPMAVACPRCGAAPGVPCNRRTLGRHQYHLARLEAL